MDDSEPIQKAIDVTSLTEDHIFVPSGTYCLGQQINLKSNVHIIGNGSSSTFLQTFYTFGEALAIFNGYNIFNFSISNVKLIGSGKENEESTFGIFLSRSSNCAITDCILTNNYLAIVIYGLDSGFPSNQITIAVNEIYDIGLNGISSNNVGRDITIVNNHITNYGQVATLGNIAGAIEFRGGTNSTISGNIMGETDTESAVGVIDGIRLEYASEPCKQVTDVVVNNNKITRVSGFGIRVQYCLYCIISENIIDESKACGIVLLGDDFSDVPSNYNIVSQNIIKNIEDHFGIRLRGDLINKCKWNTLSANAIANCREGIGVFNAEDNTVYIGIIENSNGSGVYHASGKRNLFQSGKISQCQGGVILITGDKVSVVNIESYENINQGLYIDDNMNDTLIDSGRYYDNGIDMVNNSTSTIIR